MRKKKKQGHKKLLKAFCVQAPRSSIAPGTVPGALFSNNKMQLGTCLLQRYPFHLRLLFVRLLSQ